MRVLHPVSYLSLFGRLAALLLVLAAPAAAAGLEATVTVHGEAPTGPVEVDHSVNVPVVAAAPALALTIAAEPEGEAAAGDTVTLTYRAENIGNVTLEGLTLTAGQNGNGAWQDAVAEEGATLERLAPGEAAQFVARYTVSLADIEQSGAEGGAVVTNALAEARFGERTVSAEATHPIEIEPARATIAIAVAVDRQGEVAAGDTITYNYEVTNTGNVPIRSVSVAVSHNGTGPAPVPRGESLLEDAGLEGDSADAEEDGTWDVLGPGDRVRFTATYVVTQADIDTLQ